MMLRLRSLRVCATKVVSMAAVLSAVSAGVAAPRLAGVPQDYHVRIDSAGDACSVRYTESGPKDGVVVVLLHGSRFTADTWIKTKTIASLTAKGFRVYATDLPGFGKTKCSDAKADVFLKQMFKSLEIKKAVLVSPSMSGRFSLPLLTKNPELLTGFVAVAPVGIPRFREKLKTIGVPTLAIWGEKDRVVSVDHAEILVKAMPNARKVILKRANHPCYLDEPGKFNKELVAFVTECGTKKGD